jgi:hypothetical protein
MLGFTYAILGGKTRSDNNARSAALNLGGWALSGLPAAK